jgi:hypothetical protein
MNYNAQSYNIEPIPDLIARYNKHNELLGDVIKILGDSKNTDPAAQYELYKLIEQLRTQYPKLPNKDLLMLAKMTFQKNVQARSINYNSKYIPKQTGRYNREYFPNNSAATKVFNYVINKQVAHNDEIKNKDLVDKLAEEVLKRDIRNRLVPIPNNEPIDKVIYQAPIIEIPIRNEEEEKYNESESPEVSDIEDFDINDDPLAKFGFPVEMEKWGNGKTQVISRSDIGKHAISNMVRRKIYDQNLEEMKEKKI